MVDVDQQTLKRLYRQGPLPKRMDLWVERPHYFHPLHNAMIGWLGNTLGDPLFDLGYVVGRERSLQIAQGREPDIYVRRDDRPPRPANYQYATAAAEVLAEPGVAVDDDDNGLDALHIRERQQGDLVTVLEVVSPSNKREDHVIADYVQRRARLLEQRGVNVVEIDLTRSVKRLTLNAITQRVPYHVVVLLPDEGLRVIPIELEQPLPRIALPLHAAVYPLELQPIYEQAYWETKSAWHIQHDGHYTPGALPFPSLLSDAERQTAINAVSHWQQAITQS